MAFQYPTVPSSKLAGESQGAPSESDGAPWSAYRSLKEMLAATDATTSRTEHQEHYTDDEQDDSERAQNRNVESVAEDEQDNSENNHCSSLGRCGLG